jgi:hypothetical protein
MSRKKRANFLIERRRQDVLDSMTECGAKDVVWDEERHSRIVEREGRRRRRREARAKSQGDGSTHYEGQSSDDELLQSTEKQFQGEMGELVSFPDGAAYWACSEKVLRFY